jgi:hypothetical protein
VRGRVIEAQMWVWVWAILLRTHSHSMGIAGREHKPHTNSKAALSANHHEIGVEGGEHSSGVLSRYLLECQVKVQASLT